MASFDDVEIIELRSSESVVPDPAPVNPLTGLGTRCFNLFNKGTGRAVRVPASANAGMVQLTLSADTATAFTLFPGNDPKTTNASCVSISPANSPGSFLRHCNYILFSDRASAPVNPQLFGPDSSFLLLPDKFRPGFFAFQSVNYPTFFIAAAADGSLRITADNGTDGFRDAASFRFVEVPFPSFRLVNKAGLAVNVPSGSGTGMIQLSLVQNTPAATVFKFLPGNDLKTHNSSCVSISPANSPGWFLRHCNYILYSDRAAAPVNPAVFAPDSSFIVLQDKFCPGFFALQSVNFPTFYVHSEPNGSLRIATGNETPAFRDEASFRFAEV